MSKSSLYFSITLTILGIIMILLFAIDEDLSTDVTNKVPHHLNSIVEDCAVENRNLTKFGNPLYTDGFINCLWNHGVEIEK